jgi:hypothetical protein
VQPAVDSGILGQRQRAAMPTMLGGRAGVIIIEGPPNIVRARFADQARWFTWLDLINFGVECPDIEPAGSGVARWLGGFVRRFLLLAATHRLGSLCNTAASQALHAYKFGYYPGGVYVNCHDAASEIESGGYYGGRCAAYHIGHCDVPIWHLDFRSLYPSICARSLVPARLVRVVDSPDRETAERLARYYGVIATVEIETDEPAYPCRRVSAMGNDGLNSQSPQSNLSTTADTDIIYPVGRFTTTLPGPELADALAQGRIKRWLRLAYYQLDDSLQDYSRCLYGMRQAYELAGDAAMATLAKRLLVSLPGKLGQHDRRWELAPEMWSDERWSLWTGTDSRGMPCRYRALAGIVQREIIGDWHLEACPAIAAWVTSAGRIALLRSIRIAGWRHVIYVDTDSLMVDQTGLARLQAAGLVTDGTLGALYLKSGPNRVRIIAAKHYIENAIEVCAGRPKSGVRRTLWQERMKHEHSYVD